MRKFFLTLSVAGAAVAASAPAVAQYYPQPYPAPGYGYGQPYGYPAQYGQPYGAPNNWLFNFRNDRYARMMQDRVQRIRYDIRQMAAQRILSRGEFRSLDAQARNLQDRIFRYSRFGIDFSEARRIDRQVRRLEERVIFEANDWNRRPGIRRYNPYNYGQYWNHYGNYEGYRDRDRDGRNDRFEDDRGRDHDGRRHRDHDRD